MMAGDTAAPGGLGSAAFALRLGPDGGLKGCAQVKPAAFEMSPLAMNERLRAGLAAGTSTLEEDLDSSFLPARGVNNPPERYCPAE
jgi:hypothetical protein